MSVQCQSMFLDEASIDVTGGNGGKGCVAWRREKYVPHGGPSGGNGGDGGDVIIIADANADTLSDFGSKKRFQAKNGAPGGGSDCAGRGGADLLLKVPPGTIVSDEESRKVLADLAHHGDQIIVAHGGRGGYGNAHFKGSTRQAPDFAELGEPGQKRKIHLELKLVADAGIIGYPSVGKSSLIAAVSRARPKIADYPFTTLVPNLGVVSVSGREFVLCDVPGLIEGASIGKGLGDKFLKHIERCGILVHLLDVSRDNLVDDYKAIRKELEAYSPTLSKKREVIVLNKADLVGGDAGDWVKELKKSKITVSATISAATKQGTQELMKMLLPIVLEEREKRLNASFEPAAKSGKLPVLRPHLASDQMGSYRIEKQADGSILIRGKRLEQLANMTEFSQASARLRFLDVAEKIGLLKAIGRLAPDQDTKVVLGDREIQKYL